MKSLLSLVSILFFVGCSGTDTNTSISNTQSQPTAAVKEVKSTKASQEEIEMLTITGTIVHKGMEGGFFGLDANDGKKYMPRGINKDLLIDGMVVQVKGYVLTDVLTFQQYGQVLKVVEAIKIDGSKVNQKDAW